MHKPLSVSRADQADGGNGGFNMGELDAAGMAAPPLRKKDIPTPIIATVPGYEQEQPGGFRIPDGYIRFPRRTTGEDDGASCEYCLEVEDENWLDRHVRYGAAAAPSEREKLGVDRLERMLSILEQATGQADPVPIPQAETLFVSQLGMSKVSHQEAWTEVYRYWKDKRARLGKPLLRRFWPVTSPNDTDPHKVFRPREKERYKLRKHRKNDLDSFRKLQQVKKDFEKLLNITRMIQKREVMKREQLLVQQEIFSQQHWDLTDTTGEARPLSIKLGGHRARPRQPAAAAASAAAAAGGAVGAAAASAAGAGAAPVPAQPFERAREERDRSSRKASKKRKDRDRSARGGGGGGGGGAGSGGSGGGGEAVVGDGREAAGEEEEEGGEGAGGSGAGGVGEEGTTGVIPGSHVSVMPSFMDELKTRVRMPVRTVVEPALAAYSACGGGGGGRGGGGKGVCVGRGTGAGAVGAAAGGREKAAGGRTGGRPKIGVEPVYKFRLRARIGRGGRVMWDRVPVKGVMPARGDGLADPEEAPLVVHSNYVQFPFKAPAAHVLHPPMVNLNADERRYREICAMDDDQEEMLEPLGLGLIGDSSASGSSATAAAAAAVAAAGGGSASSGGGGSGGGGGGGGSGDPMSGGGARPKIKYAIEV